MPYLNIDLDFFNHPKTLMLEAELGGRRSASVLPIMLWVHVGKYHSDDGYLKGYSPAAIAKAIGIDYRDSEKVVSALIKCGFMEQKKDGFIVHEFSQHNGHLSLFRERAKIAAETRWKKIKNPEKQSQDTQKSTTENKKPSKSEIPLTDAQIHEIRVQLAKTCSHKLISEANQAAWDDLKGKLVKAFRNKNIGNPYGYAISAATNYGRDSK